MGSVRHSSAVCWFVSDEYTHHPYSHAYFRLGNVHAVFTIFGKFHDSIISKIRRLELNEERMIAELLEAPSQLAQETGIGGIQEVI